MGKRGGRLWLLTLLGMIWMALAPSQVVGGLRVAILPFENLTDAPEAPSRIISDLIQVLQGKGYQTVPYRETYRFLLKHRLREWGSVSRATARRIGKAFDVEAILTGTVNLYREDGGRPQLGLTLRLIHAGDGSIFWARDFSGSSEDFVRYFGQGRPSSAHDILAAALKEIGGSLPQGIPASQNLSPFELERVLLPKSLPGGKKAEFSIRLIPLESEPQQVEIAIGEKIRKPLQKGGGGLYSTTIEVPREEGLYPIRIFCQAEGKSWLLDPGRSLRVDNTSPSAEIRARDEIISPNEDGLGDFASFILIDEGTEAVRRWDFSILNAGKEVVWRHQGKGSPPKELSWYGRDLAGNPLEDGIYYAILGVEDRAGNRTNTPPSRVVIDTHPPVMEVEGWFKETTGETEKGIRCTLQVKDESPIRSWNFRLYSAAGEEIEAHEGEGAPPQSLTWSKGATLSGPFRYRLQVVDVAGNSASLGGETLPQENPLEEGEFN